LDTIKRGYLRQSDIEILLHLARNRAFLFNTKHTNMPFANNNIYKMIVVLGNFWQEETQGFVGTQAALERLGYRKLSEDDNGIIVYQDDNGGTQATSIITFNNEGANGYANNYQTR
jgi:hypothetical protein